MEMTVEIVSSMWFAYTFSEESDTMWVDSLALSESERLVNRLRNANPERFRTMVKMHLSFYLELPGTGLDELINDYSTSASDIKSKGIFSGFVKNKKNKGENYLCWSATSYRWIELVIASHSKLAEPPGSQYAGTAHPVKVTWSGDLSSTFYIQTKSHCLGGGGWYPTDYTSSQSHHGGAGWYPPHFTSKVTFLGGGGDILHISHPVKVTSSGGSGILHISPTKLNVPQQWNQTDFHRYMPAQLTLVRL